MFEIRIESTYIESSPESGQARQPITPIVMSLSNLGGRIFLDKARSLAVDNKTIGDAAVGDVVRLRSGGPNMTVCGHTTGEMVKCTWFNDGEKRTCDFIPDTLMFVERE